MSGRSAMVGASVTAVAANAAGRHRLEPYLHRIGRDLRSRTLDAFERLDELAAQWPFRLNQPDPEASLQEVHEILEELERELGQASRAQRGRQW
jgi:hypothetical protein